MLHLVPRLAPQLAVEPVRRCGVAMPPVSNFHSPAQLIHCRSRLTDNSYNTNLQIQQSTRVRNHTYLIIFSKGRALSTVEPFLHD